MNVIRKSFLAVFLTLVLAAGALAFVPDVFAQALVEDQYYGGETGTGFAAAAGLSSGDLTTTIAALIRIVLGFLGILAVSFVLYGGFVFMTAGGNDDKIKKAKKVLASAVVGLVIILSAFTIVQFILSRLIEATGGVSSSETGGSSTYADGSGGVPDAFVLTSLNTECAEAMKNLQLQFVFSQRVLSSSVDAGGISVETASGTAVEGTFSVSGKRVTFTPTLVCAEDAGENCFDASTEYAVSLDAAVLESSGGDAVECTETYPCSYEFTTGTAVDTEGPTLTMDAPDDDASVYVNDIELLQSLAVDDTGVSSVDFTVDGEVTYQAGLTTDSTEGGLAATNYFYTADGTEWDTAGFEPGNYSIRAEGADCAGHSDTSAAVTVVLRAAHCDNGTTDEDETDLDCGGEDCGACAGDVCETDADCASGYCDESTGECVGVPKIEEVSAGDGAIGNLVTISGENFGTTADEITFYGDDTTDGDDVVVSAYECNGEVQWSDDEIIVQLTSAMADGPVEVTTNDGYSDRTDDDYGPTIADFDMNGVVRPGVCMLDPDTDVGNSRVEISGNNFGSSQGSSTVYFTNYEASSYRAWADGLLSVVVPLLNARSYDTQVWTGDYECLNSDGSETGLSCDEDSDCAAVDSTNCATKMCSESGDDCEEDADCSGEDESCVSRRQGSNEVEFTVVDADAGETPVIAYVDSGWEACSDTSGAHCGEDTDCSSDGSVTCDSADNWGPPGQYVTISGTGFGSTAGTVRFTDGTGYGLGDSVFPDACGEDFWSDTEITVKVPSEYQTEETIVSGTFALTVIAGGVPSEAATFVILDDEPGPGICNMEPSSGPAGSTTVTIDGDNFGSQGDGVVEFYSVQQVGSVGFWNDSQVEADVDADAQTGPVFIVSDEGYESNSLNFEVGDCNEGSLVCTGTEICCANGSCLASCEDPISDSHYSWTFSTGDIPAVPRVLVQCDESYISPSPWENWNVASEVCLNSVVTVAFSVDMDVASYDGNVTVNPCEGDASDPCATLGAAVAGSVLGSSTVDVLRWQPDSEWAPSTTYQVTIENTVESAAPDYSNMARDYAYEFTSASATDVCDVDDVYLTPPEYTLVEEGTSVLYGSSPIANRCVVLACSGTYDWSWGSSDSAASLDDGSSGDSASYGCANTATAILETPVGDPAEISATITNVANDPSDTGELTINYTDPEVSSWSPSCDSVCVNGGISVTFNTDMEDGFTEGSTVTLYTCEDSFCDPDDAGTDVWATGDYTVGAFNHTTHSFAISHDDFTADTWYRVVIDGSVESTSSVRLDESGSNYPSENNRYFEDGFSWSFRTKDSNAPCEVDRVEMNPPAATATVIGQQNIWEAVPYGAPDDCSVSGQELDAAGYDWSTWVAADNPNEMNIVSTEDVADMYSSGTLLLTNDLENGCSSDCLNTGSVVTIDDAVCGDGTTQYGEDCDDGDTDDGDGCSAECLDEGNGIACSSTVTTGCCGDGAVDADEQCDDGNASDYDGCSSVCLNNGARRAGTSCGDGRVDQSSTTGGEDCDGGNAANGDGCSSDCLYEGGVDVDNVYSICGNGGDPEDGEDCDDANAVDGDGCSSECLYEGAPECAFECQTSSGVSDGRNCSGLGATTCGTGYTCVQAATPCCGDGVFTYSVADYPDADTTRSEDCDDGDADDGDGCSSECLNEGASVSYASPSYCGDGETDGSTSVGGEECDASCEEDGCDVSTFEIGNRGVSVVQEAAAREVVDGRTGADITANEPASDEDGVGELTLVCSCETDLSCGDSSAYGCGTSSCCFTRPEEDQRYPATGAEDVCLNTAVWVSFTAAMDEATFDPTADANDNGSIDDTEYAPNLFLELVELGCSDGTESSCTTAVTSTNCPESYADAQLAFEDDGSGSWAARAWRWVVRSVRSAFGRSATAATYACLVPVTYGQTFSSDGSVVALSLANVLEEHAQYRFVVVKDATPTDAIDEGVLSANAVGVEFSGTDNEDDTTFVTGTEICELEEVVVEDLGIVAALTDDLIDPSVEYFTEDLETHQVEATPYTVRGGDLEQIAEIPGVYAWDWGWASSCADDESSATCTNVVDMTASVVTTSVATAEGNSGRESVVATASLGLSNTYGDSGTCAGGANAGAECASDATCPSSTCSPAAESGTLQVTANVCDNQPTNIDYPYVDDDWNFSFYYCRDAGDDTTTADDLPELDGPVDVSSYDPTLIVQELIFQVNGTSDAIGLRVLANESYLSASAWYEEQGFTGSPAEIEFDGYDAVRDGNTTYVAAANRTTAGDIYPNIYVISYSEDAGDESQEIFDQILATWSMNANVDEVTDVNLCVSNSGSYPNGTNEDGSSTGSPVECTWDGDCLGVGAGAGVMTCDGEKAALTRDMRRLTDVTEVAMLLEDYGDENGYCSVTTNQTCEEDDECPGDEICEPATPKLSSGTFVASLSVSTWPSWSAELANALGTALPEDPVNDFYVCDVASGYEATTCWNATEATFACPDESHVYGYQSSGGTGFALYAQLEYDGGVWTEPIDAYTLGSVTAEYDYGGSATLPAGFAATESFCSATALYGDSALCGDGLIGALEACEIGDVTSGDRACDTDADGVGDGVVCISDGECEAAETCELISCDTGSGTITTTCSSACDAYQTVTEAVTGGAECVPYTCGNGVVEEENLEVCDDGSLNGTYGHCGDSCTLSDAFSCGDGYLAGGEDCDCGETDNFRTLLATPASWAAINTCGNSNGQYEQIPSPGCAWDCTSPGPMCGDAVVNGGEECDGDYESWDGGLCTDLSACSTDADCDDGSTCGSGGLACATSEVCEGASDVGDDCSGSADCESGTCTSGACAEASDVGVACVGSTGAYDDATGSCEIGCSSFTYELTRSRTCQTSGAAMCDWNSWTACESPDQYCGNGTVEGDETCDDGNGENTDACTNDCVENACGDDYVYSGVESCDDGDENGAACDAQYGGICYSCTTNCQYVTTSGEYCGDGTVNGPEFCDGADLPYYYFFINSTTYERTRGSSCETISSTTTEDTDGDSTTAEDTYTCRELGICNGGDWNGEPCTIDPSTGVSYSSSDVGSYNTTSGAILSGVYAACGTDGECVAPTCADNCSSMCPFSYESAVVTAQTESSDTDEDSVDLYAFMGGTEPDNAVFYMPACSVATQIMADVDTDAVVPPSVAIFFVTDYTGTMAYDIDGDEPDESGFSGLSRMDLVSEATSDAITRIYSELESSDKEIGLLRIGSPVIGSGSPGHVVDKALGVYSETELLTVVEGYPALTGVTNVWGPSIYLGLEEAVNQLEASSAEVKVVIVLSDGNAFLSSTNEKSTPSTSSSQVCQDGTTTTSACPDTTSDGTTAYNYICTMREIDLGIMDDCSFDADIDGGTRGSDISVYTAAITTTATNVWASYMAHISSETCTGSSYGSISECTTGTYAFSAQDEDGIAEMYEAIIDSILGVTFELSSDASGSIETTFGAVVGGRNKILPFPENFACTGSEVGVPFTLDFAGTGYVNLSDISLTYCPAP